MILRFVTAAPDLVSVLIQRGEYGFWASHTEAVMPNGTLLGAHSDGGVMARPAGYDAKTTTRAIRLLIPCSASQDEKFQAFLAAQLGKPYDMDVIYQIAASPIMGERDWRETDSWICSELQAAAVEASGYCPPFATDVNHITPRDLLIAMSNRPGVVIQEEAI